MRSAAPNHAQEEALHKMREVLQEGYTTLRIARYRLEEDFDAQRATLVCSLHEQPSGEVVTLEAQGVGLIHALFEGLCARYATTHDSLSSLRFTSFSVRGLVQDVQGDASVTAQAEAAVGITNAYGVEFTFLATSPSVSQSSVEAVLAAVEYFLNSERAYVKIYDALEHYRREGRTDLVAKYTDMLSQMVRNTSYSSLVEKRSRA